MSGRQRQESQSADLSNVDLSNVDDTNIISNTHVTEI